MLSKLAILLAVATPANSQVICADQTTMLGHLGQSFNESPVMQGASANGWLVQLWMSSDGSTWSLVGLSPDGTSACMLASGEGWHPVPQGRPS